MMGRKTNTEKTKHRFRTQKPKGSDSPFGRHHGVHEGQMILVNHGSRRRTERNKDKDWEGVYQEKLD